MTNKSILVDKDAIKKQGGVVVLDLEKYQELERKIEDYERKKRLLANLDKFEKLAQWGRGFAKKKKITQGQVLEND